MEILQLEYTAVALSAAQVVLGVLVLILAKFALRLFSPYSVDREMTSLDGPSAAMRPASTQIARGQRFRSALMLWLTKRTVRPSRRETSSIFPRHFF